MFKIDIFVLKDDPLAREEMRRRQRVVVGEGEPIEIASPEDTVLQKLAWYRIGDESSSRQWDDLLGVLKVSGRHLDFEYLAKWAPHLRDEDHLERAYADAGIGRGDG